MGAGVVKPEPNGQGFSIRINTGGMPRNNTTRTQQARQPQRQEESMNCEECAVQFSAFKKKKPCKDCARNFCSACTVQVNTGNNASSPREQQCKKCQILLAGSFTRSILLNWKIKDLKALLNKQNVNTSKCKEKNDLIDLVFTYFGGNPNFQRMGTEHERLVEQLTERMRQEEQLENQQTSTQNRPSVPSDNQPKNEPAAPPQQPPQQPPGVTAEVPRREGSGTDLDAERLQQRRQQEMLQAEARMRQELEEQEKQEAAPENPHLKLEDIKSEEEIESLNIRSLKRVLLNNFVDFKGCCERWELQERLKRLWKDNEANKKKADEQRKVSEDPSVVSSLSSAGEDELCKICMDAVIDCVLLECGHMATCTKCGKQLAECPICRQYVVRAVHTFKA